MSGKDFLKDMCKSFFIIVTLVNVCTYILGSIFQPDATFGYEAFLSPLVYGFCSMIPCLVMYSKKELSVKALLIRKVMQLISLELILVCIGLGVHSFQKENVTLIFSFCFSVFIVYLLVHLISWALDTQQAKKMTADILAYQNKYME